MAAPTRTSRQRANNIFFVFFMSVNVVSGTKIQQISEREWGEGLKYAL
jgi:hypothetical protein